MFRFLLTPKWIALHALTIVAVVGCAILGNWQLDAFRDSQGRHDEREREPVALAELAVPGTPLNDAADRRVQVTGQFVQSAQMLVPGRIHADTLGSYVLTPLQTSDGVVVPVLRGWVDTPDKPAVTVPTGEVSVTGYLLPPETSDHATIRTGTELTDGEVGHIAPDTVAAATGLAASETIQGYLLMSEQTPAVESAPAVLDIDVAAPIRDVNPWQNLSYWAQWWVFGLAAVAFWVSAVRSGLRTRRAAVGDEVSGPAGSPVPS